jgi:hypothetical protein
VFGSTTGLLAGALIGRIRAGGQVKLREVVLAIGFLAIVFTGLSRFIHEILE